MNIWENEAAWQNALLTAALLLNHALSLLKTCPELRDVKGVLIKGNREITQPAECGSSPICCARPSQTSSHPFSFSTHLTC